MHRVFVGLGMGDTPGADIESQANLATRMLRGNALAAFTKAYADAKQEGLETAQQTAEDNEPAQDLANGETAAVYAARIATARNGAVYNPQRADINMGFHAIMLEMCPAKSLQRQKRWMRRHVRKTRDITVRNFASNLARINNEEIPLLPPRFDNTQKLADDEMLDIFINACPKKWQSEMAPCQRRPLLLSSHDHWPDHPTPPSCPSSSRHLHPPLPYLSHRLPLCPHPLHHQRTPPCRHPRI